MNDAVSDATRISTDLVNSVIEKVGHMPAYAGLVCTTDLISRLSSSYRDQSIKTFASLLPDLKSMSWHTESDYDDRGGAFTFVETLTYHHHNGIAVTIRDPSQNDGEPVMEVAVPDGIGIDPAVEGLQALSSFDDEVRDKAFLDSESADDAFLRLFASFSGFIGGREVLRDVVRHTWGAAYRIFCESEEESCELR